MSTPFFKAEILPWGEFLVKSGTREVSLKYQEDHSCCGIKTVVGRRFVSVKVDMHQGVILRPRQRLPDCWNLGFWHGVICSLCGCVGLRRHQSEIPD